MTGQCLVQIYFSYPFFILPSYLVIYTSIIKIDLKILSLYNAIFRSMLILPNLLAFYWIRLIGYSYLLHF